MSVQVKRRRDTAANVAAYTGAQGELIVDTTDNRLTVHDGSTAGGWAHARIVDLTPTTNRCINGGFDIWQNGTSFTVAASSVAYTADQWLIGNATAASASITQASPPSGFSVGNGYALSIAITGALSGSSFALIQRFEAHDLVDIDSKACAVSFDLSASTSAGTLQGTVYFQANTATDNGTFSNTLTGVNFTVPSGAGRVSVVIPAASTVELKYGAQLCIQLAQAAATGNITATFGSIQFENGAFAHLWSPKSAALEWLDCERFYQTSYNIGETPGSIVSNVGFCSTLPATFNYPSIAVSFRVRMRALPTITLYSPTSGSNGVMWSSSGTSGTASDVTASVGAKFNEAGFLAVVQNITSPANTSLKLAWTANARL